MPKKTKREWIRNALYVNDKEVANIVFSPWTGEVRLLIDRDPRTGKRWRSKKRVREFMNSLEVKS